MEFVTRTFTGLRSLNIHRCARLQSPNVCLISRLTSLTSLNVGQVPRVDDGTVLVFFFRSRVCGEIWQCLTGAIFPLQA
jgi:hypothetical protein